MDSRPVFGELLRHYPVRSSTGPNIPTGHAAGVLEMFGGVNDNAPRLPFGRGVTCEEGVSDFRHRREEAFRPQHR